MMIKIRPTCCVKLDSIESVTLRPDGTAAVCMASGQVQTCAAEYSQYLIDLLNQRMLNEVLTTNHDNNDTVSD